MNHNIFKLEDKLFKRKTGVHKSTFRFMELVITNYREKVHKVGGRKMKLNCTEQLLMTLEYLREYTTYFSLGLKYNISESNCYKIIKLTEETLLKTKEFHLPNKNSILNNPNIKVVAIDAAETKTERPKKSRKELILERKNSIHKKKN
jgi:hypothetical protein